MFLAYNYSVSQPNQPSSKMLTLSRTRVRHSFTSIDVATLVEQFDNKEIIIPPHQREYRWEYVREEKFIQSILMGYPIPSILFSKNPDERFPSVEDGRQRLTAASRFRSNNFGIHWGAGTVTYDELPERDQDYFNNSTLIVQTFYNATSSERIQIFDNQQNGIPLTVGEKLHAQIASPLVSLVMRLLMTPGVGLHDRAIPIWGVRGDPVDMEHGSSRDKRRKWLTNATALIMGLVYGPKYATKKYEPHLGLITNVITTEKETGVFKDLVRIIEIFEEANLRATATAKNGSNNTHFDIGTYTGCIMFSLSAKARKAHNELPHADKTDFEDLKHPVYTSNSLEGDEEEWLSIKAAWVDYIVGVRNTINETPTKKFKSVLEETIHKDKSAARSWTTARWEDGYRRVFGLDVSDEDSDNEEDDECGSEFSEE